MEGTVALRAAAGVRKHPQQEFLQVDTAKSFHLRRRLCRLDRSSRIAAGDLDRLRRHRRFARGSPHR